MTTYTPPIADMGFVMAEVAGGDISAITAHISLINLGCEARGVEAERIGGLALYKQAP